MASSNMRDVALADKSRKADVPALNEFSATRRPSGDQINQFSSAGSEVTLAPAIACLIHPDVACRVPIGDRDGDPRSVRRGSTFPWSASGPIRPTDAGAIEPGEVHRTSAGPLRRCAASGARQRATSASRTEAATASAS
jgi:hypothetical protein